MSVSEGVVTMATMTAPESPATSPRVGQVPHALSPRQWTQEMLRPGRAMVCDVESTDFDGAIVEIAVIDAATGAVLLDTLVDPGAVPIHPAVAAVHGISADADRRPPLGGGPSRVGGGDGGKGGAGVQRLH
ncbi:hypothetical protein HYG77_31660 (plasmid) [Rhodococcus sp. ZPP]|uniref:hypothetical protein n=1 Tax=Rhodococcus sp. ZPP TaxID=2749906 RepID=UPI001AD87C33|nr:hypothetical protein [Rhodococcus sp. ZPP]QTJ70153.1 hypothetical protein HYG77_31660 [Rhodococcus sp. ZPP]